MLCRGLGRCARGIVACLAHRRLDSRGRFRRQLGRECGERGFCVAPGGFEPLGRLRLPHHDLGGVRRVRLPTDLCDPRVERLLDLARCRRPLAPAPSGQGDELAQAEVGWWRWRRLGRGEGPRYLVGDGRDFAGVIGLIGVTGVNRIAGVTDVWLG